MRRRLAGLFLLLSCLVLTACVSLGRAQQVERLTKDEFERLGLGKLLLK